MQSHGLNLLLEHQGLPQVSRQPVKSGKLFLRPRPAAKRLRTLAEADSDSKSTISSLDSLLGTLDEDLAVDQSADVQKEVQKASSQTNQLASDQAAGAVQTSSQQAATSLDGSKPQWQQQQLQQQQDGTVAPSVSSLAILARQLILKWAQDQLKRPELVAATGHTHLPRVVPRLSYIMLGLNLLVYGAGLSILFTEGFDSEQTYFFSLAKVNEAVAEGEYYRFLSSLFLHDSLSHLGVTVSTLYSVATQIESALGYQAFLSVFILSGLTGSVAAFALSDTITVGPSASLFGLIGALGAYLWKNRGMQRNADQVLLISGAALIAIAWGAKQDSFVDNVGHIAGLLSGGLLSWGISPQYDADDIDIDNRELAAERAAKMAHKSLNERHKAEAEAAELSALDLAVDKTSIWAKLFLPLVYSSGFVGTVVYILHDRYGHLPAPKWLPDLF